MRYAGYIQGNVVSVSKPHKEHGYIHRTAKRNAEGGARKSTMSKIPINDTVNIDLPTLIDTRLLVQANSGGGKSWLLRRLLEQSHGKVQQIVIDLEGEFSTLRETYDYILAAKEGDTAAESRSAALLAKRLLELNVSAIIDLYELSHQERKRFVRLFLSA